MELEKIAKREKYYEIAQAKFENLKKKLTNDKEKDLKSFKAEVIQFLRDEIVGRYYYEGGQIKTNLKDDKQLFKAIEILKNENEYESILSPEFENKQQLGMKISMLDKGDI
jgi:carboxyl-terminal processing protease